VELFFKALKQTCKIKTFERSRPRGGRYAWLKVVAAG
jgi:hypothetical protein